MQIWLEVKNFAKIKEAKVCVNKYSVFVGPNNCGKTFLMQLIEGINGYWNKLIDNSAMNTLLYKESESSKVFKINATSFLEFAKVINRNIKSELQNIVADTFEKNIPIGELNIEIKLESDEEYTIYAGKGAESIGQLFKQMQNIQDAKFLDILDSMNGETPFGLLYKKNGKDDSRFIRGLTMEIDNIESGVAKRLVGMLLKLDSLFMPASRNGLMLLYREFFAHKTDSLLSFQRSGGIMQEQESGLLNLTKPMYNFLRFLQTYSLVETRTDYFQNEILFYNEKIIDGRITTDGKNGFRYSNRLGMENVPMYLTSSMVNEVAPLFLAIISKNNYERFIIDEVEASLHPEKQRELVRLLNRLYNRGCKFIISTHSDTFVNKLNNLAILSNYVNNNDDENILNQFEVDRTDLIKIEDLYVYEFVQTESGQCEVHEKVFNSKYGYQFDLFTKSALTIYNEAIKLEELTKDA